ncbi:endonuclease V [Sorangium sp. So ce131]|uniref:endonuclease V n=1 Tax=Sorangium sp. So ce131 TaxID=3133282 RepID=UPI003F63B139
MIAALDVSYGSRGAAAACVLFRDFADPAEETSLIETITEVAPYEPGAFYRRELPCLLAVLRRVTEPLAVLVVDGYVWLSHDQKPGLGAHLFEALAREVTVVGVSKTSFAGSDFAIPVLRGGSQRPLFVTAAGVEPEIAAGWVARMHGAHRIPTLLKRVDRLCREAAG